MDGHPVPGLMITLNLDEESLSSVQHLPLALLQNFSAPENFLMLIILIKNFLSLRKNSRFENFSKYILSQLHFFLDSDIIQYRKKICMIKSNHF